MLDPRLSLAEQIDLAVAKFVEVVTADPALAITFANPLLTERVMRAQREGAERYARLIVTAVAEAAEADPAIRPITFAGAYMATRGIHEAMVRAISREEDMNELIPELQLFLRNAARADTATGAGQPVSGAGRTRARSAR